MKTNRDDIQTLRAIAVIFVVAYHYGIPGFTSGFIGVDIFFVISGYLITQVIDGYSDFGFSNVIDFISSRLRRIYPALLLTIIACLVVGYLIQPPDDFLRLQKHAALSLVFLSNIGFWREAGYFDAASNTKALLHTWSLAVEGQYYALIAGFIFLVGRCFSSTVRPSLILLIIFISFGYSVVLTNTDQAAAFFLLPTRAWEFLGGALVALRKQPSSQNFMHKNLVELLIVTLIGLPLFINFSAKEFPGYMALFAMFPAMALLAYGGQYTPSSMWRIRPVIYMGNISYSLYLWHWPVYVFARALGYVSSNLSSLCALISISVLLASLSYLFIETPIRRNKLFWTSRRISYIIIASVVMSVSLVLFGDRIMGLEVEARDVKTILGEINNINPRRSECFFGQHSNAENRPFCQFGATGVKISFILWGDSHADSLMTAVGNAGRERNKAGLFAGFSGCPPLLNVDDNNKDVCAKFNQSVYYNVEDNKSIDTIIMIARWSYYIYGDVNNENINPKIEFLGHYNTITEIKDAYRASLLTTVCKLTAMRKRVYLIEPVPEVGENVPGALAAPEISRFQRIFGRDRDIRVPLEVYRQRNAFVMGVFKEAKDMCGANIIETSIKLCGSGKCQIAENGRPLYRDGDHLSEYGATYLLPMIGKIFN